MDSGAHLLSTPMIARRLVVPQIGCGGNHSELDRTCVGESAPSPHAPSLLLDGDDDNRDDQPYDSFKIISRKALTDYKKAERIFLDFLASADVWSQDEVRPYCVAAAASRALEVTLWLGPSRGTDIGPASLNVPSAPAAKSFTS